MSDWRLPQDDGHTPLSEEDCQGLLLSHIATRHDLNDAEQRNIATALRRRAPTADRLLDDMYLCGLHKAMFGEVWNWAGKYRQRVTNIGIAPAHIAADLRMLTDDAKEWVRRAHFEPDELAVRFHHRLVTIHPFPDGNGHHSRIGAEDIQGLPVGGEHVSDAVARLIHQWCASRIGASGFSDIGAVVGATWPHEAAALRRVMPHAVFLVPGFGAQGGSAAHAVAGATERGDGVLVSSSRAIAGAWQAANADREFATAARDALDDMNARLNAAMAAQATSSTAS